MMKKIYLSHPSSMNYGKLYDSISKIESFSFILPHQKKAVNSKNAIKKCDAFVADVSKPSHGVGIEIGWANSFGKPVVLMSRKGSKVSSSLKFISKKLIIYRNFDDAKEKLENELRRIQHG